MAVAAPFHVDLIACSQFTPPADVPFIYDAAPADSLIEFAGRACYETWDRPNPHTATNESYVRHIMEVGHTALLEHPTATFYIRGLSRLCSHEFIRHRHFSFSQLSQRYVPDETSVVVPPAIAGDEELTALFIQASDVARDAFGELLDALKEREEQARAARQEAGYTPGLGVSDNPQVMGARQLLRAKQARQAARAILPGAVETRLVVTGNFRTWRHFIGMRAIEHADIEMRRLAVEILRQLQKAAPHAFDDFAITQLKDGSEVATSPFVSES